MGLKSSANEIRRFFLAIRPGPDRRRLDTFLCAEKGVKMRKKKSDLLGKILSGNLTAFMNQPKIKRRQDRLRKSMAKHKAKFGY